MSESHIPYMLTYLTSIFILNYELMSVIPFSGPIVKDRVVLNYLMYCMWPLTSPQFILFSHLIKIVLVKIEDSVFILLSQK